jgi:hypothetical protein
MRPCRITITRERHVRVPTLLSARAPLGRGFLLLLLAAGCGDTTGPLRLPAVTIEPASVQVDVGQTAKLTATVTHVANTGVQWTSLDPTIASVAGDGTVTGVAPGVATIVAASLANPLFSATAQVTVRLQPANPYAINLPVLGLGAVAERFTAEVAVRGEWAYTSTWGNRNGVPGNVVKIWNVSGNVPVLVDSLIVPTASTVGDVQISDDGALLVVATEFAPGTIVIYDRSNPARPVLRSQFSNERTTGGVHTVKLGRTGGRQLAFLSVNPPAPRLIIVDITNPASPFEVWHQNMGNPFIHDTFFRDGILFAALWHDGLRIFDLGGHGIGGTPSAPVLIGNTPPGLRNIHNIWWFHDPRTGSKRYVFLGEEGPGSVGGGTSSGDIYVVDVSTLAQPRVVAQYTVPGAGTHNFWMDEESGILYAAYYNGGVRALNVRGDLGTCTADQRMPNGNCDLRRMGREVGIGLGSGALIWGVVHQGTHVYASDMRAGLYKLDASGLKR